MLLLPLPLLLQRVLAVLLRSTCISLAVSSPHQTLSEPAGAVLLRGGRVPQRTLLKLLQPHQQDLAGVLWGCETLSQREVLLSPASAATLQELQDVVRTLHPQPLPWAWWDQWSPASPASCNLPMPGAAANAGADGLGAAVVQSRRGPQAALVQPPPHTPPHLPTPKAAPPLSLEAAAHSPLLPGGDSQLPQAAGPSGGGGADKGPPCSMAALFLQHYLDSLGAQNTFG
ncbi:hypothetical protein QJQ45_005838 [Haematococcus lacustris]|nr:hypothetical protein QJQ45_005838 [Haematococcus lacustris]